jgi:hypothetical protein
MDRFDLSVGSRSLPTGGGQSLEHYKFETPKNLVSGA